MAREKDEGSHTGPESASAADDRRHAVRNLSFGPPVNESRE